METVFHFEALGILVSFCFLSWRTDGGGWGLLVCSPQRKDVFERHSLCDLLSKASTPKRDWSGLFQGRHKLHSGVYAAYSFKGFMNIYEVYGMCLWWGDPFSLPIKRLDLLFRQFFPFCFSRKVHKDTESVPLEAQKARSFEEPYISLVAMWGNAQTETS